METLEDIDDFENFLIPNNSLENCFICGVTIIGKKYSLASTHTHNTKSKLVEKLGEMIRGKYIVIISELDMICSSCANLINTIDRVENEVTSIKRIILRFLEKKYGLEPGELVGSSGSENSTPSGSEKYSAKGRPNNESFMSRKRKAALTSNLDFENNQENTPDIANRSDKKSNTEVWMQCDKCKYSTPYNSFVNNHIKHISKKSCLHCNYCFGELKDGNCAKNCDKNKTGFPNIQNNESSIQLNEENINNNTRIENVTQEETVELISAEINDYNNRTIADSNTLMMSTLQENNTRYQNETFLLPEFSPNCSQPILIDAQHVSGQNINHNIQQNEVKNICDSVQVTSQTSNHNLFSNSKFSEDDNSEFVQAMGIEKQNPDTLSSMTKQLITVGDDGSVEMVQVVWDELVMSGQGTLSF